MTKKKARKDWKKSGPPVIFTIPDSEIPMLEKFGAMGTRLDDIAQHYGMCPRTLDSLLKKNPKLMRAIKIGSTMANIKVAKSLFNNATENNNTTAQIFWLKCRAGWKEPQVFEFRILQEIFGKKDLNDMSLIELENLKMITEKAGDESEGNG